MKQKDIILIAVVVFISAIVSYFGSNALFASPKKREAKVEVVSKIDSNFPEPDKKFFNSNSINPTQLIKIGDSSNQQPFNTKSQ